MPTNIGTFALFALEHWLWPLWARQSRDVYAEDRRDPGVRAVEREGINALIERSHGKDAA